jgi:hypothetical protein
LLKVPNSVSQLAPRYFFFFLFELLSRAGVTGAPPPSIAVSRRRGPSHSGETIQPTRTGKAEAELTNGCENGTQFTTINKSLLKSEMNEEYSLEILNRGNCEGFL